MAEGAGVYKIVDGKTSDTIYETQTAPIVTTEHEKPNVEVELYLIGDE